MSKTIYDILEEVNLSDLLRYETICIGTISDLKRMKDNLTVRKGDLIEFTDKEITEWNNRLKKCQKEIQLRMIGL